VARILHVEDISELANSLAELLGQQHEVTHALDLASAKNLLEKNQYDLLILDVSLPDGLAFDHYQNFLKEQKRKIPVIFLTGLSDLPHRMKGLELGAQDYILKPFYSKELILRIEMRLQQFRSESDEFVCGDLHFDKTTHQVFLLKQQKPGAPLNLTPNEYRILLYLAVNKKNVISRADIVENVWGGNTHISDKAVNSHISNLRKKIQDSACKITSSGEKSYLLTVG
jgi:two-component system phosphate regulon response regulator PhoB